MQITSNTLIISTYNWPEALDLVLKSILAQKILPDEVLIADDGSTDATKQLIASHKAKFPVPLVHFWQEDKGFRKAVILNKVIAQSNGDYIIQADGDCILHPNFVQDHLQFAEANTYLFGSRVNIKKAYLETLFKEKIINFNVFSKGIKKRFRTLHIPVLSRFYKKESSFSKKYRGCNTSYFKKDFIAVNGYNEYFEGWGREDSELALRFHNYGLSARRLKFVGIVYHIFHYEKPKDNLMSNDEIEKKTIKEKIVWTSNGINKYLKISH